MLGIFATKIALSLYLIKPPRVLRDTAVTKAQALQIIREARGIIKPVGVKLIIKKFRQISFRRFTSNYYSEANLGTEFIVDLWLAANKKHLAPSTGGLVHFVAPRSLQGYMYGQSLFDVCGYHATAYSFATAQERNLLGAPRHFESSLAAAHEFGHGLGAEHSNEGFMRADVLLAKDSTVSEQTVVEVKACLKRRAK